MVMYMDPRIRYANGMDIVGHAIMKDCLYGGTTAFDKVLKYYQDNVPSWKDILSGEDNENGSGIPVTVLVCMYNVGDDTTLMNRILDVSDEHELHLENSWIRGDLGWASHSHIRSAMSYAIFNGLKNHQQLLIERGYKESGLEELFTDGLAVSSDKLRTLCAR